MKGYFLHGFRLITHRVFQKISKHFPHYLVISYRECKFLWDLFLLFLFGLRKSNGL